jgi:hypothetical protein
VGADRKGPLAAFIVLAIIAAILLITSVRSQAATGWLGRALPSTPGVARAVGGGLDHVGEQGAVLVHKAGLVATPGSPADHTAHQTRHPTQPPPTASSVGSARDAVRHGRHLGWRHAQHGDPRHGHPDHGRHLGHR